MPSTPKATPSPFYLQIPTVRLPQSPIAIYYLEYKLNYSQYFVYGQEISNYQEQTQKILNLDEIIQIPMDFSFKASQSGFSKAYLSIGVYLRRQSVYQSGIERVASIQLQIASLFQMIEGDLQERAFDKGQGRIEMRCFGNVSEVQKIAFMMSRQDVQQQDKRTFMRFNGANNELSQSSILHRQSLCSFNGNREMSEDVPMARERDRGMIELIGQNDKLQNMVMLYSSQRQLQKQRHEQQMKQLARELSIKDAETLMMRQAQEKAFIRAAELLDERQELLQDNGRLYQEKETLLQEKQFLFQEKEALLHEKKMLLQQISIQKQRNFSSQGKIKRDLKIYEQQKAYLQKDLQSLRAQSKELFYDFLIKNTKYYNQIQEMNSKLSSAEQKNKVNENLTSILQKTINALKCQLSSKEQQLNYYKLQYQQRLTHLQNKLSSIQEGQLAVDVNGGEEDECKVDEMRNSNEDKIKIQDNSDASSLNRIAQEQLQQSINSIGHQTKSTPSSPNQHQEPNGQFSTSETIRYNEHSPQQSSPFCHNQYELLKLLTKNLQKQYDQLKKLYQSREQQLQRANQENRSLWKQIQDMRFDFMHQVSKVSSLVNNKLMENESLRQLNQRNEVKISSLLVQRGDKQLEKGLQQQEHRDTIIGQVKMLQQQVSKLKKQKDRYKNELSLVKDQMKQQPHIISSPHEDISCVEQVDPSSNLLIQSVFKSQTKAPQKTNIQDLTSILQQIHDIHLQYQHKQFNIVVYSQKDDYQREYIERKVQGLRKECSKLKRQLLTGQGKKKVLQVLVQFDTLLNRL